MKNIVFIINLKEEKKAGDSVENRSDPYIFSINSWKNWCESKGYELFVLTERIAEQEVMNANWHKSWALKILEENGVEYNQVCIVDADTIVHPDCPDFFKETDGKFSAVMNDGCYEWVSRSIKKYGDFLFPKINIKTWEYFNSGFMVVGKNHLDFFEKVHKFYFDNLDNFKYAQSNFLVGNDQTPLNYLTKLFNVDVKILPNCYNLQDMFRKNLLHIPGHSWWEDELKFLDTGWIYHFNAIPNNSRDTKYWMERTYKHLYGDSK
jgi:hypothetical protein